MKKFCISGVIILLFIISIKGYSKNSIKKPKGGFQSKNISITDWNSQSRLSFFTANGSSHDKTSGDNRLTDPYYFFDLNLGFVRFFARTNFFDSTSADAIINKLFPFVLEIRPFDFASFLSSGSRYSLFVEDNELIRNFTLILSNKMYSSSQFVTSFFLWQSEFISSGLNPGVKVVQAAQTSTTPLENFYPATLGFGLGFSDKFHLYQSPTVALGLMIFLEFTLPRGTDEVLRDIANRSAVAYQSYFQSNQYSDQITYGLMAGLFFRYVQEKFDLKSSLFYHRRQGDFDAWAKDHIQDGFVIQAELAFDKQFFAHIQYFVFLWDNKLHDDELVFNNVNLGGEIKGFGRKLEWLGVGLDFHYVFGEQTRKLYGDYSGTFSIFYFVPALHFYPLSFHDKNHSLKISFLTGFFFYHVTAKGIYHSLLPAEDRDETASWKYSLMLRISYSF